MSDSPSIRPKARPDAVPEVVRPCWEACLMEVGALRRSSELGITLPLGEEGLRIVNISTTVGELENGLSEGAIVSDDALVPHAHEPDCPTRVPRPGVTPF
jgi:hypothetical protein